MIHVTDGSARRNRQTGASMGVILAIVFIAVAENKWPIAFLGNELDRDAAKRQIVSLYKEIESKKGLRTKVEAGLTNLDVQKTKVV